MYVILQWSDMSVCYFWKWLLTIGFFDVSLVLATSWLVFLLLPEMQQKVLMKYIFLSVCLKISSRLLYTYPNNCWELMIEWEVIAHSCCHAWWRSWCDILWLTVTSLGPFFLLLFCFDLARTDIRVPFNMLLQIFLCNVIDLSLMGDGQAPVLVWHKSPVQRLTTILWLRNRSFWPYWSDDVRTVVFYLHMPQAKAFWATLVCMMAGSSRTSL
jgi:hypothetical protein